MSAGNVGYSEGWTAPASITREFGHKYRWLKDGNIYEQVDQGVSNNWVLEDPVAGAQYLDELLDVQVPTPSQFDTLVYNTNISQWINVPISNFAAVGNSLFVSAQGRTVAQGAIRENITFHFSDIEEARDAALSGDTIYVYGGTHTPFATLTKEGVKWVFLGGPVIQSFANIWDSLGGTITEINVKGDAEFRTITGGRNCVNIEGATRYMIEGRSMTGLGSATVRIDGGTDDSFITTIDDIDCTGTNYTVTLLAGAKGTINARNIDGHQTSGGLRIPLYVNAVLDNDFTINANVRANQTASQNTVAWLSGGGGTVTINGDIYDNPITTPQFFWGEGMIIANGKIVVNGNLYQTTRHAVYRYSNACDVTVNGNIYNSSPYSITNFLSGTAVFALNGDVYNTTAVTAFETMQTAGSYTIKGRIYHELTTGNTGEASSISLTSGGTGYAIQSWVINVPTTGGTGTGMTVSIENTNTDGTLDRVYIYNPGSGYIVGDVVTISGAGNGDATFTVEAVDKTGVMLERNSYDVIIDESKVVFSDLTGTVNGLAAQPAGGNKDVIITSSFATNGTTNNINNLVVGTLLITDSNIK